MMFESEYFASHFVSFVGLSIICPTFSSNIESMEWYMHGMKRWVKWHVKLITQFLDFSAVRDAFVNLRDVRHRYHTDRFSRSYTFHISLRNVIKCALRLMSGVLYIISYSYNILVISARDRYAINYIFVSECGVSSTNKKEWRNLRRKGGLRKYQAMTEQL